MVKKPSVKVYKLNIKRRIKVSNAKWRMKIIKCSKQKEHHAQKYRYEKNLYSDKKYFTEQPFAVSTVPHGGDKTHRTLLEHSHSPICKCSGDRMRHSMSHGQVHCHGKPTVRKNMAASPDSLLQGGDGMR